jgi:hypothetical protein
MELRPANPRILRHAVVGVDRSARARTLDARDPEPGYPGMRFDLMTDPSHGLDVWVPGASPWVEPDGMAWRLDPGSDLVLQLQLRPGGERESIQPSIALYFASAPPVRDPVIITLESTTIDIPAGSRRHAVIEEHVLPADVQLLSVYPHAHNLARELRATATLPDGTTKQLLRIGAWDLHWAERYRYRTPIDLPRGTTIRMEFVYDNSESNPLNPSYPPRRVRRGPELTDEMAVLWLQVVPRTADGAALLKDNRPLRP